MATLTETKKLIVLKLFKDFTESYNPSSIAKVIKKSRVAAFKALNELEDDGIVIGKTLGKARFYRLQTESEYAMKYIGLLLLEEAKGFLRWKDEFIDLYAYADIAILFGSIIRNVSHANDIDLLLIYQEKNNKTINDIIAEKNKILPKRIHLVRQTKNDFKKNLIAEDKVIVDAVRNGIVLHGTDGYVELITDVTIRK